MSETIKQIFMANPITTNAGTDLMYFGQSPYTALDDAAMTFANFALQFSPAGAIEQISFDSGSVTGTTVTIKAGNNINNCGSSVFFNAGGTDSLLFVTDINNNTFIGNGAGNLIGAGGASYCTGVGINALAGMASGGAFVTAFGGSAGSIHSTGQFSSYFGYGAGSVYTTESNNVAIQHVGVVADSGAIRIGTQGTQTSFFGAGINNTDSSGFTTPKTVFVDSSTGQLGFGTVSSSIHVNGDTGSMTGGTLKIWTNNATQLTGATVKFVNSGTTSTLTLTDQNFLNIMIGNSAGNSNVGVTSSITRNVGLGTAVLNGAGANCAQNSALGDSCLASLTGGIGNSTFGYRAGLNYNGNESYNILLGGNVGGTPGESHTIRLGNQGSGNFQQNRFFAAGIAGVSVSNLNLVTIDTSTGQLGSEAFPPSSVTISGDTGTPFSTDSFTIYANNAGNACGSSVLFDASTPNVTLQVTDSNHNTIIGSASGNNSLTGQYNSAFGNQCFPHLTSGSFNELFGDGAGNNILDGNENIYIGINCAYHNTSGNQNVILGGSGGGSFQGSQNIMFGANVGSNYGASESSNILFSNSGSNGESNTIRIGTDGVGAGQQNRAFIAGTAGVIVSNLNIVTIDTTTGQLGSQSPSTFNAILNVTNIDNSVSPYTVLDTDQFISIDTTSGAVTVLLPDSTNTGRYIVMKDSKGNAFTNNITITTVSGTDLIDGLTTRVINVNYQSMQVIFDGTTNYEIF